MTERLRKFPATIFERGGQTASDDNDQGSMDGCIGPHATASGISHAMHLCKITHTCQSRPEETSRIAKCDGRVVKVQGVRKN